MSFRYSFYGTKKRERTAPSTVRSFSHIPVCLPYTGSCPTHEAPAPPTSTMIRENSLFCKPIRIKSSSKILFDSFMAGFRSELQTCPCCGARGSCCIHAYYNRSLVDFIGGARTSSFPTPATACSSSYVSWRSISCTFPLWKGYANASVSPFPSYAGGCSSSGCRRKVGSACFPPWRLPAFPS